MRHFLMAMLVIMLVAKGETYAQDVYFAAIRTEGGRGLITGFLYKVGDSTLEILPGRTRRDSRQIQTMKPLAIPIHLIREISISRVRSAGTIVLESTLLATAAAVISIVVVQNNPRLWLPTYLSSYIALFAAYTAMVVKSYSPDDHFFRERLEDRSIVKDERSLVRN